MGLERQRRSDRQVGGMHLMDWALLVIQNGSLLQAQVCPSPPTPLP